MKVEEHLYEDRLFDNQLLVLISFELNRGVVVVWVSLTASIFVHCFDLLTKIVVANIGSKEIKYLRGACQARIGVDGEQGIVNAHGSMELNILGRSHVGTYFTNFFRTSLLLEIGKRLIRFIKLYLLLVVALFEIFFLLELWIPLLLF